MSSRARAWARASSSRKALVRSTAWTRVLLEPGVGADHDVLHHGHAPEQADVLEGAGHAQVGDLVGLELLDAPALELDGALVAVVEAGDGVEEGGLAGAVGADDAEDPARARCPRSCC